MPKSSILEDYDGIRKNLEKIKQEEEKNAKIELTEGKEEERNWDLYDGLCGFTHHHFDINEAIDTTGLSLGIEFNFDPKYDYKAKNPIKDEKVLTYMDYMLDEDDNIIGKIPAYLKTDLKLLEQLKKAAIRDPEKERQKYIEDYKKYIAKNNYFTAVHKNNN